MQPSRDFGLKASKLAKDNFDFSSAKQVKPTHCWREQVVPPWDLHPLTFTLMFFLLSFLTLETAYQILLQINKLCTAIFHTKTVILRFCWSNSSIHDTALRSISSFIQHGNVSIRLTDVSTLAHNCNQHDQTLYNCFIVIAQNPGNLLYSPTLPLLNAEHLVSKKTVISICGCQEIVNYCGIIFSQEGSFRCIFKLHVPPLFLLPILPSLVIFTPYSDWAMCLHL